MVCVVHRLMLVCLGVWWCVFGVIWCFLVSCWSVMVCVCVCVGVCVCGVCGVCVCVGRVVGAVVAGDVVGVGGGVGVGGVVVVADVVDVVVGVLQRPNGRFRRPWTVIVLATVVAVAAKGNAPTQGRVGGPPLQPSQW